MTLFSPEITRRELVNMFKFHPQNWCAYEHCWKNNNDIIIIIFQRSFHVFFYEVENSLFSVEEVILKCISLAEKNNAASIQAKLMFCFQIKMLIVDETKNWHFSTVALAVRQLAFG